jgi:aspartyl/asparaginyl beta-hydroxylase (cupin superfamily)
MADTAAGTELTFVQRLKKERRKRIKRLGKRLTAFLGRFLSTQSLVGNEPVLRNDQFPFLRTFTENWEEIRDEVIEILKHREAIPAFQEVSPDQKKISKGKNWRTFILFGFGSKLEKNCRQAPLTAKLLEAVPHLQTAWFSILGPGYHIPAHTGVSKGILRAHLGLIIPKDAEKCRLRVADRIQVWHPGEIFVFDDTYEHEVWNETTDERVILLFDFDRPMKFWGRAVTNAFLRIMKMTAFYQEPKKNMADWEDRFEAATRRADDNMEALSKAE